MRNPTRKDLENLACHQMHQLIQKGKYEEELKDIWRKRWLVEYPYHPDCTGTLYRID